MPEEAGEAKNNVKEYQDVAESISKDFSVARSRFSIKEPPAKSVQH